MRLGYLAVGSTTTHRLTDADKHPRGQLLAKCGRKHATKMYVDTKDGGTKHIGYVIDNEWFRVYEVHEWTGDKNGN